MIFVGKIQKYGLICLVVLFFVLYMFQEDLSTTSEAKSKVTLIDLERNMSTIIVESDATFVSSQNITPDPKSREKRIVLLFWTTFFGTKPRIQDGKQYKWPFYFVGDRCPVKCELTTQQHRISEASAIVFHARDFSLNDLPPKKFTNLPWVLQSHENPVNTPTLRDSEIMSKFNFYVSYRLDSDFPSPEFVKPTLDLPLTFKQKTRLVLAVYSNCEGLRTHYMRELKKYIKIDFYGNCLRTHKFLSRKSDGNDTKLLELLRSYKFTLVFPNADCDYYVTEKMYNALSSGSVPIWLGSDKINEILQWGNLKHSVIKVKDFTKPKDLAAYLKFLANNENEYNKYLKWKYKGFQFPPEYYKSPIGKWWEGLPVYCRVCMRIAKDKKGRNGLPVDICDGTSSKRLAKLIP